ncbi:MAG: ribonuclease P protein component [Anaerolineae bacterium]|nr:ribonuclease P protein component [Thermoflexales bacterium]MDW8395706.1 ribonuclease P protein component [Anaerolineae bacterium]
MERGLLAGAQQARHGNEQVAAGSAQPKLVRLKRREDFERVRREGVKWKGRYCAVNAAPQQVVPSAVRVGFVTARTLGRAVKRNRARRLLRESMRALAPAIAPGWDIVLIAYPALAVERARVHVVRDELLWLLGKANLITETSLWTPTTPQRGGSMPSSTDF